MCLEARGLGPSRTRVLSGCELLSWVGVLRTISCVLVNTQLQFKKMFRIEIIGVPSVMLLALEGQFLMIQSLRDA